MWINLKLIIALECMQQNTLVLCRELCHLPNATSNYIQENVSCYEKIHMRENSKLTNIAFNIIAQDFARNMDMITEGLDRHGNNY